MREYRIGRLKGRFVVTWTDEGGTRRRYRLAADTLGDAEREARDVIIRATTPAGVVTVAQIWQGYQDDRQGRRRGDHLAQTGRNVLPHFGHLRPDQITKADCRDYIARRRQQGRAEYTIRTEMSHLRDALKWGVKERLIPYAPEIERPSTPPPRDRYLSRLEVETLLAVPMVPHIRLAILLMLTTAGRATALLELTWDRVDLDRGVIRLATNDIGPRKGRATVPINATLRAALESAKQYALSDYVIEWGGRRVGSIKTGFNAATAASGLPHFTQHDLRRTAGRFMAEAGVPIEEIAQYLGHTSTSITRSTYSQFSPDHLRRAADALELGGAAAVRRRNRQTPKHRATD